MQIIFIFYFSKKLLYFDDAFVPHEVAGNNTIQDIVEMEVILFFGLQNATLFYSLGAIIWFMEDHEGIVVNLLDITFHKKREMPLQPLCGVRFRKKYSRRERIMKIKRLN